MEANFAIEQGSVKIANFNIMELKAKNYHKFSHLAKK